MKRLIIIVILSVVLTFSQNVSPEFSELNGMEDQADNTHLFYRINTATYDSINYLTNTSNDIYHCPSCRNKTKTAKTTIPYAFKLLIQEMMAMNIAPRIKFKQNKFNEA